eukprot:10915810-Prorocentrum_lima.AAC.1
MRKHERVVVKSHNNCLRGIFWQRACCDYGVPLPLRELSSRCSQASEYETPVCCNGLQRPPVQQTICCRDGLGLLQLPVSLGQSSKDPCT